MEILTELGFSKTDMYMLLLCPLFTTVGGLVHVLMTSCDLSKWPVISPPTEFNFSSTGWKSNALELMKIGFKHVINLPAALIHPPYWVFARLALSALTGLVVGLYFVGSFPSSPGGVARIFALCVIIGYVAPSFWLAKEKWMLTIIESDFFKFKVAEIIKQASNDRKALEKENDRPS